jgi:RNA polymerase sigma factor (sigma-70 family)
MPEQGAGNSSSEEQPFQTLAAALREGDSDAWKQIVREYTPRLIGLARSRLDSRLQQKLSAEDVVQSVYGSFFRRHKAKPFRLNSWEALWGLLVVMTVRKCCRWHEHYYEAQRRNVRQEVSFGLAPGDDSNVRDKGADLIAREPTPAEAALLVETLHETMRGLEEREREIIKRGLLGYPDPEISQQVGRTHYTVRQARKRYSEVLQRLDDPDAGKAFGPEEGSRPPGEGG